MIKKKSMLLNIFLAVICFLISTQSFSQSSLAAYFRFCGCSLKDVSGKYTFKTSPKTPKCVNTILDQGMDFSNNDDDIYLYADNIPEISSAITLATWIMPNKLIYSHLTSDPRKDPAKPAGFSFNPIFTKGKSANIFDIYTMACDYDSLYLVFSDGSNVHLFSGTIKPRMTDNKYYHLAATYDMTAGKIYLYFNGKRIATHNYNKPLVTNPAEPLVLGESFPLGDESFSGAIDEVRIYNKALSAFQIDSIYKTTNQVFLNLKDTFMCANNTVILNSPNGFASYLWKHKTDSIASPTYTAKENGIYILKIKDAQGCTYIDTLNVSYYSNPSITPHASKTEICKNEMITLSGSGAKSYVWSNGVQDGVLFKPTRSTYSVTGTDANSCTGNASISIQIDSLPVAVISGITPICENESTTLNASGGGVGGNYKWSENNLSSVSITVSPSAGTTLYSVTVTNAFGCTDDTTFSVKVNALPVITCTPLSLCINSSSISLNTCIGSPSGGTGIYTGDGINGNNFDPATAGQGTHIITYTYMDINSNCTQKVTSPINVLVKPDKPLINPDSINICEKESVTLQATAGMKNYHWDDQTSQQSVTQKPPQVGTYLYSVTVTNLGGCTESDVATVIVNPIPVVQFDSDKIAGCEPLTIQFSGNQTSPQGGIYHWNFGVSSKDSTSSEPNPSYVYYEVGKFDVSLTVTTLPHCKARKTINQMITVYPIPHAAFIYTPRDPSIYNPDVTFTNQTKDNTLFSEWNFGDDQSPDNIVTNQQSVTHTFTGYGKYPVRLIVKNDPCADTVMQYVFVKTNYTFFAPNAFTPNNDGLNDLFYCKGTGISDKNFHLYIYSRWGEKIFEATDINNSWDGKAPGSMQLCPDGIYTWLVLFEDSNGESYKKEGVVTLIK